MSSAAGVASGQAYESHRSAADALTKLCEEAGGKKALKRKQGALVSSPQSVVTSNGDLAVRRAQIAADGVVLQLSKQFRCYTATNSGGANAVSASSSRKQCLLEESLKKHMPPKMDTDLTSYAPAFSARDKQNMMRLISASGSCDPGVDECVGAFCDLIAAEEL